MQRVASLSAAALLCASLGAADDAMTVADLRFSLGTAIVPNYASGYMTDVKPSIAVAGSGFYDGAPIEETYQSATGGAGALTAIYGTLEPIGLLWGLGFRYASSTLKFESARTPAASGYPNAGVTTPDNVSGNVPEMSYGQNSGVLELGIGAAMSSHWHAELMATGSVDWVSLDMYSIDETTGWNSRGTAKGLGFTYGARLGFYWTDESQWQYGFGAAWNRSRAMLTESAYSNFTAHVDATSIGYSAYSSIGYRF